MFLEANRSKDRSSLGGLIYFSSNLTQFMKNFFFSSQLFILVLFLADVKVYVDDYRKRMVASCDGKTIITVNPGLWKFRSLE